LSNIETELARSREEAKAHSYSVQQLTNERGRLRELFSAFASAGAFSNGNSMADVASAVSKTQSQFFQDIYALLYNQGKRDGYFVEFGACDGLALSNTLLLEQDFGWKGILAEPSKRWQDDLKKSRTATLDFRCVSSVTGDTIEFEEAQDPTQSTIAKFTPEQNKPTAGSRYSVETISLYDLLQEHKAPKVIDFMSVDVEGPEYQILSAFPFDKYQFKFMCVEHHGEDIENAIKRVLAAAGYKQVHRAVSGHDGFYVPS
jgi:FkbM family methyltransferase